MDNICLALEYWKLLVFVLVVKRNCLSAAKRRDWSDLMIVMGGLFRRLVALWISLSPSQIYLVLLILPWSYITGILTTRLSTSAAVLQQPMAPAGTSSHFKASAIYDTHILLFSCGMLLAGWAGHFACCEGIRADNGDMTWFCARITMASIYLLFSCP